MGLRPGRVGLLVAVASALLQLGPVLGGGYVLLHDMVFVPSPPLTDHLLGVDGLPRAVPSELVVALASHVLPGDVVQDLVLLAILVFAGWGASRLVPSSSVVAAAATALLYSWNPYVTERLQQGQWAVLVGYAALPWATSAALALRQRAPGAGARLVVAMSLGALGGASAELLCVVAVLPVALWPGHGARSQADQVAPERRGRVVGSVGVALVLPSLPWLIPGLTMAGSSAPDRVGATVFAAHPDTPLGTLGSVLGLGGIWNSQVVPAGRDTVLVGLVALLLTLSALVALWRTRARWPSGGWPALVTTAAISLVLAMWGATPGARAVLSHLVASSTGAGLLRDGQRWLAPFVLVVAIGFGVLVEQLVTRAAIARVLVVAPVLLLPAAAWGGDGTLATTHWPADWHRAASAATRLPAGPVLVLPWSQTRLFVWNDRRPTSDPADAWLGRRTVGDDALDVSGTSTPLEDPAARRVAAVVTGTGDLVAALRRDGYAGVLVERDQPLAGAASARVAALRIAVSTPTLTLFAVSSPTPSTPAHAPVLPAVAAELLALLALVVATTRAVVCRTRCRSGGIVTQQSPRAHPEVTT